MTDTVTAPNALDRLTRIATTTADVLAESVGRLDTCILSTRVVVESCRYFGIAAVALPVRVMAANPVAWTAIRDGVHPDEWPEGAHTVGFDERHPDARMPRGGRWPGHLVASVRVPEGRVLVDASAGQFARPERDLAVPSWVGAPFPDPWDDDRPLTADLPGGGGLIYGPTYGPLAAAWRDSPDWRGNVSAPVAAVIRACKDAERDIVDH